MKSSGPWSLKPHIQWFVEGKYLNQISSCYSDGLISFGCDISENLLAICAKVWAEDGFIYLFIFDLVHLSLPCVEKLRGVSSWHFKCAVPRQYLWWGSIYRCHSPHEHPRKKSTSAAGTDAYSTTWWKVGPPVPSRLQQELSRNLPGRVIVTVWATRQKQNEYKQQDLLVPWHLQTQYVQSGDSTSKATSDVKAEAGFDSQNPLSSVQQGVPIEKGKQAFKVMQNLDLRPWWNWWLTSNSGIPAVLSSIQRRRAGRVGAGRPSCPRIGMCLGKG